MHPHFPTRTRLHWDSTHPIIVPQTPQWPHRCFTPPQEYATEDTQTEWGSSPLAYDHNPYLFSFFGWHRMVTVKTRSPGCCSERLTKVVHRLVGREDSTPSRQDAQRSRPPTAVPQETREAIRITLTSTPITFHVLSATHPVKPHPDLLDSFFPHPHIPSHIRNVTASHDSRKSRPFIKCNRFRCQAPFRPVALWAMFRSSSLLPQQTFSLFYDLAESYSPISNNSPPPVTPVIPRCPVTMLS